MKVEKTGRGFSIVEFKDRYDEQCSIQDSSLATEDAIWLGVNNPKLQMMASDGQEGGTGWVTIPLHEKLHISASRMHLTREQVEELLPILERFVETGSIGE